ncbi:MAG: FtsX-like permease family protein, partial [Candidatus Latescibacteria bacterium]|nr:FtsX-like permease family protein [Candidatus Latescibacterota bacterium]
FMNLATARSTQRAREIGVRKTVGASKWELIGQFMGESMLITVFASILALGLVEIFLPAFNSLTDQELALDWLDIHILPVFSGITFVTGLISGSYPAFYLSGFNPIGALRGSLKSGSGAVFLRRNLVIFQFVLAI